VSTHAERMAERNSRMADLAKPLAPVKRQTGPPRHDGRVLHHLDREGRAKCGAYPEPHHITGREPECERCRRWYRALLDNLVNAARSP